MRTKLYHLYANAQMLRPIKPSKQAEIACSWRPDLAFSASTTRTNIAAKNTADLHEWLSASSTTRPRVKPSGHSLGRSDAISEA